MSTSGGVVDNDLLDELLGDFLDESGELLGQLNENLLRLDQWVRSLGEDHSPRCDEELLNEMFRAAHSLKGLSAMLGLNEITDLTHKMENIFDAARSNQLTITSHVIDLIFQSVDRLDAMVICVKNSTACQVDCTAVMDGIRGLLEESGVERGQATQAEAERAFSAIAGAGDSGNGACLPAGRFATGESPSCVTDLAPDATERLASGSRRQAEFPDVAGDTVNSPPQAEQAPPNARRPECEGPLSPQPGQASSGETDTSPAAKNDRPSGKVSTSGRQAAPNKKPVETLRVDIERLDQLMNLVGQLVINKARFSQVGEAMKSAAVNRRGLQSLRRVSGGLEKLLRDDDASDSPRGAKNGVESICRHVHGLQADLDVVRRELEQFASIRPSINDLSDAVHDLDRVSSGIQKTVMDTRMVPIGPLFSRFRRVIRDIARVGGKEMDLLIRGEKTELDKRTVDELADPLTHMIRNSADHGIEPPEAREAAGKPRQGTVALDAFHRGNSIVIQVSDDGKGLDPDKIRAKAIQKEIISTPDCDRLSDDQVFQLIWEPGFSTAESVTDVSGRGMGMDIVRSKIEGLSGVVDMTSSPGKGTTFTIKLPLTMAIVPSLLVEIDSDIFAIPIQSVVEIVRVDKQSRTTVHGKSTACVRGQPISLVDLGQLFSWKDPPRTSPAGNPDDAAVVIVRNENREIGLFVHRLLGEDDVVIKSLADNYRNVEGIAGANILGDGRVSLILDVAALIARSLCEESME